jgi:hypothetical protein
MAAAQCRAARTAIVTHLCLLHRPLGWPVRACVRAVLFFEPKALYRAAEGPTPAADYEIPLG